jgi:hypothetical protein
MKYKKAGKVSEFCLHARTRGGLYIHIPSSPSNQIVQIKLKTGVETVVTCTLVGEGQHEYRMQNLKTSFIGGSVPYVGCAMKEDGGSIHEEENQFIMLASISSTGGHVFSILGDGSMLLTTLESNPHTSPSYTVQGTINAADITGFRLEAMKDPSLPFGGPGLDPTVGNFHLSECVIIAVPEPGNTRGAISRFGAHKFYGAPNQNYLNKA